MLILEADLAEGSTALASLQRNMRGRVMVVCNTLPFYHPGFIMFIEVEDYL